MKALSIVGAAYVDQLCAVLTAAVDGLGASRRPIGILSMKALGGFLESLANSENIDDLRRAALALAGTIATCSHYSTVINLDRTRAMTRWCEGKITDMELSVALSIVST